ncbi:MAG: hypothetical protein CM15mP51_18850 [Porticoccaceae bacterium]|nr:MAG: hypothetical protein CM15mP51_18850 [Porticoccaceae bacterium]
MSPSQKVYGSMDILVIWLRVIGFILLLVSATTFVNIHYGDFKSDYPSGLGGYIGVFLGEHVVSVFGYIGGTILLIFIFMFGLTVFADISWVNLIKFIANSLVSLSLNLKSRFARRSLSSQRAKKKQAGYKSAFGKTEKASEFLDNRDPVVVKRSNIHSAESTRATKEKQQNLFPDADLGNFYRNLTSSTQQINQKQSDIPMTLWSIYPDY